MRAFAGAGDVAVRMRVLERLPDAREPEGRHEEREGRRPGAQGLGGDLEGCAEGEEGAEAEVLAEVCVD